MALLKQVAGFLGLDFEAQARREIAQRTSKFQRETDARYTRGNVSLQNPETPKYRDLKEVRRGMKKTRFPA